MNNVSEDKTAATGHQLLESSTRNPPWRHTVKLLKILGMF